MPHVNGPVAVSSNGRGDGSSRSSFREHLESARAHTGETLAKMSVEGRALVVFLRHGGCTFCREALEDLRRMRGAIERTNTRIVLVHMMEDGEAGALFSRYGLGDAARISDPDRELYRAFGLQQGSVQQLLAWKVWWRAFIAGILHRHGAGRLRGDGRQMPGVFLLEKGEIVRAFRHQTAADRPDYGEMAECAVGGRLTRTG